MEFTQEFAEKFLISSLNERSSMIIDIFDEIGLDIGIIEYGDCTEGTYKPMVSYRATEKMFMDDITKTKKNSDEFVFDGSIAIYKKFHDDDYTSYLKYIKKEI